MRVRRTIDSHLGATVQGEGVEGEWFVGVCVDGPAQFAVDAHRTGS